MHHCYGPKSSIAVGPFWSKTTAAGSGTTLDALLLLRPTVPSHGDAVGAIAAAASVAAATAAAAAANANAGCALCATRVCPALLAPTAEQRAVPAKPRAEASCNLLLICLPSRAADSLLCLDGQLAAALAALPHRRLQQHRH